ncbi:hypothetical protein GCM10011505_37480 [Tistrella bauzanensis]|uniref:Nif11 domain-containing protein n=1 Tax=Tistrella bauzanensis TaxID=657419 RepID=A0ABQ1IUV5_9PROT|nr:hypothetical protein [Tistrella bauzanensis]GGB53001.1 hypothetical protein GCM10011505_37480 [Tistrella bauzanensis]
MPISGIQAALGFLGSQRRGSPVDAVGPADMDGLIALAQMVGYRFQAADLEEAFRIQMRARLLSTTGGRR